MANLGTLDMASRYAIGNSGQDTFDKYFARQIATSGSDSDKLAYLLGGMIGNYYGKQRAKKDNEKINKIVDMSKEGQTVYDSGNIGVSAMTPEQEKALQQQITETAAMTNRPITNLVISGGDPTSNLTDEYLRQALQTPTNIQATQQNTNGGMNNYNWKYIEDEAKRQGISNRVLQSRKAEIQADIAQQARAIYEPQIRENIYGKTVTGEDGKQTFVPATQESMINGLGQIEELRKYDPAAAEKYSTLVNNTLANERASAIKMNQAKELAQYQSGLKLGQMDRQAQITRDTARYLGDNGLTKNGAAKQPRTTLKESDRLALGKRVSELEATLKDRYQNGLVDVNDIDVKQWRQGYIDLGYPDPLASKTQPVGNTPASNEQPKANEKPEPKKLGDNNGADSDGYKNNWSDWDLNSKEVANIRMEYLTDPIAFKKKYGVDSLDEYFKIKWSE